MILIYRHSSSTKFQPSSVKYCRNNWHTHGIVRGAYSHIRSSDSCHYRANCRRLLAADWAVGQLQRVLFWVPHECMTKFSETSSAVSRLAIFLQPDLCPLCFHIQLSPCLSWQSKDLIQMSTGWQGCHICAAICTTGNVNAEGTWFRTRGEIRTTKNPVRLGTLDVAWIAGTVVANKSHAAATILEQHTGLFETKKYLDKTI